MFGVIFCPVGVISPRLFVLCFSLRICHTSGFMSKLLWFYSNLTYYCIDSKLSLFAPPQKNMLFIRHQKHNLQAMGRTQNFKLQISNCKLHLQKNKDPKIPEVLVFFQPKTSVSFKPPALPHPAATAGYPVIACPTSCSLDVVLRTAG